GRFRSQPPDCAFTKVTVFERKVSGAQIHQPLAWTWRGGVFERTEETTTPSRPVVGYIHEGWAGADGDFARVSSALWLHLLRVTNRRTVLGIDVAEIEILAGMGVAAEDFSDRTLQRPAEDLAAAETPAGNRVAADRLRAGGAVDQRQGKGSSYAGEDARTVVEVDLD